MSEVRSVSGISLAAPGTRSVSSSRGSANPPRDGVTAPQLQPRFPGFPPDFGTVYTHPGHSTGLPGLPHSSTLATGPDVHHHAAALACMMKLCPVASRRPALGLTVVAWLGDGMINVGGCSRSMVHPLYTGGASASHLHQGLAHTCPTHLPPAVCRIHRRCRSSSTRTLSAPTPMERYIKRQLRPIPCTPFPISSWTLGCQEPGHLGSCPPHHRTVGGGSGPPALGDPHVIQCPSRAQYHDGRGG